LETLALILFYISLVGGLISIVLIIYNAVKKELKHKKKKLLLTLVTFIVLFIGSTIFYGAVQSPESKARYEASEKAKVEEKVKKELAEKEKKAEEEKQKQVAQEEKNKQEVKAKEEVKTEAEIKEDVPIKTEVKEETLEADEKFVITSEPNTTAAVDEIINKGKDDASKASEEDIKKAIQFINDNYSNYWTDNETMHKGMYYGSLLEYAKKDKAKKNREGLDYTIYSLGEDTVQVIKYIYRGADKIEDDSTQANLRQIEKSLKNIPNDYK
jgi:hypothetical protein